MDILYTSYVLELHPLSSLIKSLLLKKKKKKNGATDLCKNLGLGCQSREGLSRYQRTEDNKMKEILAAHLKCSPGLLVSNST